MSKTLDILNNIKNYVTEYRIMRVEYIVELCDVAIKEIEAQENKSCKGCKLEESVVTLSSMCMICSRKNIDRYELKDK